MPKKVPVKEGFATIREAAKLLDVQPAFVRTLLREGTFPGSERRMLNELQWRWEIPLAEIEERKNTTSAKNRRPDGRSRFHVWLTWDSEYTKFTQLMAEHMPDVPFEAAYKRDDDDEE